MTERPVQPTQREWARPRARRRPVFAMARNMHTEVLLLRQSLTASGAMFVDAA